MPPVPVRKPRSQPPPLPGAALASTLPTEALEAAILDLLRGAGDPDALARSAGVSVADLRRFADAWRDAGRRAVALLR